MIFMAASKQPRLPERNTGSRHRNKTVTSHASRARLHGRDVMMNISMPNSTDSRTVSTGADIRLSGVTRLWGTHQALAGISLHVRAGEFCVLLGPSGCGKTTCLRIVAGLDQATSGRVEINGRDVTNLPSAARGVAMVFQSYALFPHLSVAENIVFGLKARSVAPAERTRRLDRAVEILGIGHLLARRPGQLSGGQQQRVALGRAIVAEAPVCLMDEPLSNLDAQLRAEMRREILALQRRLGITMLYVTHDQTEAMGMADQVILMRDGRIEQDAPPAEMYANPATAFAASFIGTPPMNIFPYAATPELHAAAGPIPDNAMLGVRPEALRLAETGLAAEVTHAEYLGADTVLACQVGGSRILARLPGRVVLAPGTIVHFDADPSDLHVFDAGGTRLTRRTT
jgi:sn-glycerol 3-phosphate transport system ATP-binding protein